VSGRLFQYFAGNDDRATGQGLMAPFAPDACAFITRRTIAVDGGVNNRQKPTEKR